MQLFIYDNEDLSISIMAKDEAAANKILKENVISPAKFTKETEMDIDEIEFD